MEEWRKIKGYEDRYEVSCYGKVRSLVCYAPKRNMYLRRKQPRLLRQNTTHDGYKRVGLSMNGRIKHITVHRLVAIAFLPNPSGAPAVNHKDEDKTNNHVSNLEWCTNKYNSNYGTLRERTTTRLSAHHHLAKKVMQMSLDGQIIATFSSAREAARAVGVRSECIIRCCKGKYKQSAGCKWRYG